MMLASVVADRERLERRMEQRSEAVNAHDRSCVYQDIYLRRHASTRALKGSECGTSYTDDRIVKYLEVSRYYHPRLLIANQSCLTGTTGEATG